MVWSRSEQNHSITMSSLARCACVHALAPDLTLSSSTQIVPRLCLWKGEVETEMEEGNNKFMQLEDVDEWAVAALPSEGELPEEEEIDTFTKGDFLSEFGLSPYETDTHTHAGDGALTTSSTTEWRGLSSSCLDAGDQAEFTPSKRGKTVSILAPELSRHKSKLRKAKRNLRDVAFSSTLGSRMRVHFTKQFNTSHGDHSNESLLPHNNITDLKPERQLRLQLIKTRVAKWPLSPHIYHFTIKELRRSLEVRERNRRLQDLCSRELRVAMKRINHPVRECRVLLHRIDCRCPRMKNLRDQNIAARKRGRPRTREDPVTLNDVKEEGIKMIRRKRGRPRTREEPVTLNDVKEEGMKMIRRKRGRPRTKTDHLSLNKLKKEGMKRIRAVPKRSIKAGYYSVPRSMLAEFLGRLGSGSHYEIMANLARTT